MDNWIIFQKQPFTELHILFNKSCATKCNQDIEFFLGLDWIIQDLELVIY